MLGVAFKEWAAVCRALADGTQTVILRKGGIAEAGGEFRPEHDRFWLYPTYFHEQQRAGLKSEFLHLIDAAEGDRPPVGMVRLMHFGEVVGVRHLTKLADALALAPVHVWSADTIRQRFHYRTPGLFALTVRVFRRHTPTDLPEWPEYAGCKTWVKLTPAVEEWPATPVRLGPEYRAGHGIE